MDWFKDTVLGLFLLAIIAGGALLILQRVAKTLWRKFAWNKRVINFLASFLRNFALSRVLAHKYLQKKDYFRFMVLLNTATVGWVVTSIMFFGVFGLIIVYFMINGAHVSWSLFVLFSALVFFFVGWFKDGANFYGVFEQTIKKDHASLKEYLKKNPIVLGDLVNKDLDELLAAKEKDTKGDVAEPLEKPVTKQLTGSALE